MINPYEKKIYQLTGEQIIDNLIVASERAYSAVFNKDTSESTRLNCILLHTKTIHEFLKRIEDFEIEEKGDTKAKAKKKEKEIISLTFNLGMDFDKRPSIYVSDHCKLSETGIKLLCDYSNTDGEKAVKHIKEILDDANYKIAKVLAETKEGCSLEIHVPDHAPEASFTLKEKLEKEVSEDER